MIHSIIINIMLIAIIIQAPAVGFGILAILFVAFTCYDEITA